MYFELLLFLHFLLYFLSKKQCANTYCFFGVVDNGKTILPLSACLFSPARRNFPPARLLIFQKISPLHVYSGLFCPARLMFFKKIFPLHVYSGLFFPARLMFSKNFSTCTFIWSCTSIRYTRVGSYLYSSTWQHALVVYQVLQLFLANAGKKERMADLEHTRFLLAQNLAGSFVICQTQIHIL